MSVSLIHHIPQYRSTHFPNARLVEWTANEKRELSPREFCGLISDYADMTGRFTEPNMRIATFSYATRADMLAFEFAALGLGHVICPLHGNSTQSALNATLNTITPDLCVTYSDQERLTLLKSLPPDLAIDVVSLENLTKANVVGKPPSPQSPGLIITTSGSSGEPKGVILSHENICFTVTSCLAVIPIRKRHVVMSWLPVSHIFERIALLTSLMSGADIHLTEGPRHGYSLLRKIHPHFLTAVPRNLERVFGRFHHVSRESGFFTRQIYEWALQQGKKRSKVGKTVANWLAMGKLKSIFGFRINGIIVGGAAMDPLIIRWYSSAGIRIRQGYGLSEISGVATFNRFRAGEVNFDSVGRPIPGVEVKISEQQIFIKSPGLMIGYCNIDQIQAADTIDGWFPTGDSGFVDEKGFLHITGRLKDNFKNATGQYVSPTRIERRLRTNAMIENALVHGLSKPYNIALIKPDFIALETWAAQHDVHWTAPTYMVHNPEVLNYFATVIKEFNINLASHEQVERFALVPDNWTFENDLLTPSLKLRRHLLEEKYTKLIRDLYTQ